MTLKQAMNALESECHASGKASLFQEARGILSGERDGARYLVSPRGETDWVKNLRVASEGELGGERFHASEVPVGERAPIVDRYQEIAGRSVASHFKALPDPADHPVFRIDPV